MMALIKFRVEDGIKHLMYDEEFRRRAINAYMVQVEQNHGWGFTIRYKGYRIRFDLDGRASSAAVTVYMGYADETPENVQKTLLEVS